MTSLLGKELNPLDLKTGTTCGRGLDTAPGKAKTKCPGIIQADEKQGAGVGPFGDATSCRQVGVAMFEVNVTPDL